MNKRKFCSWMATYLAIATLPQQATARLAGVKSEAVVAVVNPVDAFVSAYNPAGLASLPDRWDLGGYTLHLYGRSQIRDLPTYPAPIVAQLGGLQPSNFNDKWNGMHTNNLYSGEFAIKKGWCFHPYRKKVELAAGYAVWNKLADKTSYGRPVPLYGTTPLAQDFLMETASFSLATRICEMHSLGIALEFNMQRVNRKGFQNFDHPGITLFPGHVTNRGFAYSAGLGVQIGYLFEYDGLKLGVSWTPRSHMRKFDKYKGFDAQQGSVDNIETLRGGIGYRFCNLTASFGAEYLWIKNIRAFGDVPFPDKTGPQYLFGGDHGPGNGYRNLTIYTGSLEYEMNRCYTLRCAYRRHRTLIERDKTFAHLHTLPAFKEEILVGGTWKFSENQEVSLLFFNVLKCKIKGKNSIPRSVSASTPGGVVQLPINAVVGPDGLTDKRAGGEADIKAATFGFGISLGRYF